MCCRSSKCGRLVSLAPTTLPRWVRSACIWPRVNPAPKYQQQGVHSVPGAAKLKLEKERTRIICWCAKKKKKRGKKLLCRRKRSKVRDFPRAVILPYPINKSAPVKRIRQKNIKSFFCLCSASSVEAEQFQPGRGPRGLWACRPVGLHYRQKR